MVNFDIFRAVRKSEFFLERSHFLHAEEDMLLGEQMSADRRAAVLIWQRFTRAGAGPARLENRRRIRAGDACPSCNSSYQKRCKSRASCPNEGKMAV